jgi:predicted nucleic acid-binding protein
MIALDTSFLLDYLDGVEAAGSFVEARDDLPLFAPSLSLFEVYRGTARAGGANAVDDVEHSLAWVDPLPLDDAATREAAMIEAELLEVGQPVNLGDVLIAGICRQNGADLVTRDGDFDRIDGLGTIDY